MGKRWRSHVRRMSRSGAANEVPSGAFSGLWLISSSLEDEIICDRASCLPVAIVRTRPSVRDYRIDLGFLWEAARGGEILSLIWKISGARTRRPSRPFAGNSANCTWYASLQLRERARTRSRVSRNSLSALIYAWGSTPPSLTTSRSRGICTPIRSNAAASRE